MPDCLDLSPLRQALQSLQESLAVVQNQDWFEEQGDAVQDTLIAGVIQNFEFVYEVSIKMLKRQIEMDSASPLEVDQSNFRDLLRFAGEKGLIRDVEAWFTYRKMRNLTAHTYDHEKAEQVYAQTLLFMDDAKHLLSKLEERNERVPD